MQQWVTGIMYDRQTEWNISKWPSAGDSSMSNTPAIALQCWPAGNLKIRKIFLPMETKQIDVLLWANEPLLPSFSFAILTTSVPVDDIGPYFHGLGYHYNSYPPFAHYSSWMLWMRGAMSASFCNKFYIIETQVLEVLWNHFPKMLKAMYYSIKLPCFYNS